MCHMDVESNIVAWKTEIATKSHLSVEDLAELEDHLRDEMEELQGAGLSEEEAFLVAARRMGSTSELAGELRQANLDKTWAQLPASEQVAADDGRLELWWVAAAALVAAVLGKVPLLFGVSMVQGTSVYAVNLSLFVIPVLIGGYYVVRRFHAGLLVWLGVVVAASAVAVNVYPFKLGGSTELLTVLHLPMQLWLVFGVAYTAGEWRNVRPVWDFVRFTGEFVIYCMLIGLGGVVFMMLTMFFFSAIGLQIEDVLVEWVGFSGLLGIPVVAAYLVEKKRSLIENIAPVLARIFIPMFLVMMVAFIVVASARLEMLAENRNLLIIVDLLLALVTGMVLYD
ncbi:MAG: permease prefix domain 1-containing protein, partial [Bacillota bacterium]